MEFVPIEDGGGVAKYVIDSAFDIGIDVVLAPVVGEKRVLMAEEAAMLEDGALAAIGYGDGLSGVVRSVFEGDVVGLEARAVDLDGFRKKVPPAVLAFSELVMTTSSGDMSRPTRVMFG